MSQALYRKYRSRTLDEVLGQDHITGILKRALERQKIAHAYLLTGPRGTGKTSVARILAHEINQLPYADDTMHLDIIEIDAASNNGVDDIRSLREKAQVAPVSAKFKVYIIDEVHMLSKPAFNALLKTLEEPPSHVIFILATTDADKLPNTILSRVQQYYFHPISQKIIVEHLKNIAKQENFLIDQAAAELIAEHSRGGFRDSISLLDQLSSVAGPDEPLTRQQVADSLGLSSDDYIYGLLQAYQAQDAQVICQTLDNLADQGSSPVIVAQQLLSAARHKLLEQPNYVNLIKDLLKVSKSSYSDLELLTVLLPQSTTTANPPISKTASSPKPKSIKLPETPKTKTVEEPRVPAKTVKPASTPTKPEKPIKDWNWQKFLDTAKEQSLALYSLLAGCDHEFTDNNLIIYAGKAFTKKKLDNEKNRLLIHKIIQESHGGDAELITRAGTKPLQDEKLAAVASIMGGGEEVKLEELS